MKRVLIIDGDEMFRFFLAEWIEFEGLYPLIATGGYEGLQLARSQLPALILCDRSLPGMDGLEVLKELQSDQRTAHIPFFFLTYESRLENNNLSRSGANGVIYKGEQMDPLRQLLHRLKA